MMSAAQHEEAETGGSDQFTMSSSPSSASLTSESSFDPNDPEADDPSGPSTSGRPAPLGIVEIARMARRERKARKASQSPVQERGPITLLSPPESPLVDSAMGVVGNGDVFAKDVLIRGWKIVGGKGSGDKAKVGAYVGQYCVIRLHASVAVQLIPQSMILVSWPKVCVYRLMRLSSLTDLQGGIITILRRYTDFVNLREGLKARFPVCHPPVGPCFRPLIE